MTTESSSSNNKFGLHKIYECQSTDQLFNVAKSFEHKLQGRKITFEHTDVLAALNDKFKELHEQEKCTASPSKHFEATIRFEGVIDKITKLSHEVSKRTKKPTWQMMTKKHIIDCKTTGQLLIEAETLRDHLEAREMTSVPAVLLNLLQTKFEDLQQKEERTVGQKERFKVGLRFNTIIGRIKELTEQASEASPSEKDQEISSVVEREVQATKRADLEAEMKRKEDSFKEIKEKSKSSVKTDEFLKVFSGASLEEKGRLIRSFITEGNLEKLETIAKSGYEIPQGNCQALWRVIANFENADKAKEVINILMAIPSFTPPTKKQVTLLVERSTFKNEQMEKLFTDLAV